MKTLSHYALKLFTILSVVILCTSCSSDDDDNEFAEMLKDSVWYQELPPRVTSAKYDIILFGKDNYVEFWVVDESGLRVRLTGRDTYRVKGKTVVFGGGAEAIIITDFSLSFERGGVWKRYPHKFSSNENIFWK